MNSSFFTSFSTLPFPVYNRRMTTPRWQIRVDTGGTFTDCLAISPHGRQRRAKVLSSSALRAQATPSADNSAVLQLDHDWELCDDFLVGAPGKGLVSGGRPSF